MDNNITELVSYYDILFKKYTWYFYNNEEWYTYINIKDGVIINLKKSEEDLVIFLKKKLNLNNFYNLFFYP